MTLTQKQADTLLTNINTDESMTSSYAQLMLDIANAFPELKSEHENVLEHAAKQLPLALEREARNREYFALMQEGINRRKNG